MTNRAIWAVADLRDAWGGQSAKGAALECLYETYSKVVEIGKNPKTLKT